uniref:Uncharacterized protein n=1 Tax=Anguilla anguilla TaxID=7936 RepID=A0A0E9S7I0_ANGAN
MLSHYKSSLRLRQYCLSNRKLLNMQKKFSSNPGRRKKGQIKS